MMTEFVGETGRWLVDRVARSPVSFLPASTYYNSAIPSEFSNPERGHPHGSGGPLSCQASREWPCRSDREAA
jgi:hypothetical protein